MCISSEELKSIEELAVTSEETEELARKLHKVVTANPQEAKRRSSDRLRAVRLTPEQEEAAKKAAESMRVTIKKIAPYPTPLS